MKRGCIIVVLLLLAVLVVGGVGGYWYLRAKLGLDEAAVRSYDEVLTDDTRVVAAVEPRQLSHLIEQTVLPEIEAMEGPEYLKTQLKRYAVDAIPNQIALLIGLALERQAMDATLFVNERYFGPAIAAFTQRPEEFRQHLDTTYTGPPFMLPERGILVAETGFPLLTGVQPILQEYWPENVPPAPMAIEGGHLLEVLLDNRQGELLHFAGALARQDNPDITELFRNTQQERAIAHLLRLVSDCRLVLDLEDDYSLSAQLTASRMEESPSPLQMTFTGHTGPALMEALEKQLNAGQLDAAPLVALALQHLDQFSYNLYFDNQREAFMTLMANLGMFETPEMAAQEQQLKTVIRLMTESSIEGFLMDNGDLTGEWQVHSAPEDQSAVFVALGFLPIDPVLIPALEDLFARLQMTFDAESARMEDDVAYARNFTIKGFKQGILALVDGRADLQNLLSQGNAS
ncbi:MAG: hypothetical protein ACLFTT_00590 [Candidatus Hydrogenedentota bacterium]